MIAGLGWRPRHAKRLSTDARCPRATEHSDVGAAPRASTRDDHRVALRAGLCRGAAHYLVDRLVPDAGLRL